MTQRGLAGALAALLAVPALAQPIPGPEVAALVAQAMTQAGQPGARVAAPIRAFPPCDHTPHVAPGPRGWAMVEMRCDAPAPWRRTLRTNALPAAVHDTTGTPHTTAANPAPDTGHPVLVAARPIARGERLRAVDLRPGPAGGGQRLGHLTDLAQAEGRRLRVSLMPDQPVLERHLDPAYDVAIGERVALRLVAAGIEIGISATALENGWRGDRIMVQPWNSPRKVQAQVIVQGIVQATPKLGARDAVQ